jgi:hypothetical protein
MKTVKEEEWPDILEDNKSQEEYGRISDAVGELTSAILDCKFKELMTPGIANHLRGYFESVLMTLDG